MSTTELIDPRPTSGRASTAQPLHDAPQDIVSLLGVVPQAGPPIVLLAVPLVLFALLLAGPALLLLTLVVLLLACAALVALAGAIVASPFLLARRLAPASAGADAADARAAARFVPVGSRQAPA